MQGQIRRTAFPENVGFIEHRVLPDPDEERAGQGNHGSPDVAGDVAFQKIKNRIEGARMAAEARRELSARRGAGSFPRGARPDGVHIGPPHTLHGVGLTDLAISGPLPPSVPAPGRWRLAGAVGLFVAGFTAVFTLRGPISGFETPI